MKHLALKLTFILTSLLGLTACGIHLTGQEQDNIQATDSSLYLGRSSVDLNLHPMNKTVCDPFNDNTTQVMKQGVLGTLFYQPDGMAPLTRAVDFLSFAIRSDKTLFFSDINVPTRLFDQGFSTQTTSVLTDNAGNKLIEKFGIKFETNLQLSSVDEDGDYELALLSDDGARLKYKDPVDDTWKELIDNDGDHPTRMGCTSTVLSLNRRSQIPLELLYYQGPRFHIANILMWRKVAAQGESHGVSKDPLCGQSGNHLYFDPDHSSTPQAAYKDLQSRGWRPIAPANFWLDGTYNPCVVGTKPSITNFRVTEVALTDAFLSWTTDIPASTQVKLINETTHEEILTAADNLLRTNHDVHVTGLKPGTTYRAQAVSISQDLGNSLSQEIVFTTR